MVDVKEVAEKFGISEELVQRLISIGVGADVLRLGDLEKLIKTLTDMAEHSVAAKEIQTLLSQG